MTFATLHLLVLQGPNLNLLGQREPHIYGRLTLDDLERMLQVVAQGLNVELSHYQSNSEGALVDRLHQAKEQGIAGVVINPAAYTHTSIALRDAFLATELPFVEIHLSNIHGREPFRQQSFLADIATGRVTGLGAVGYELALRGLVEHLRRPIV